MNVLVPSITCSRGVSIPLPAAPTLCYVLQMLLTCYRSLPYKHRRRLRNHHLRCIARCGCRRQHSINSRLGSLFYLPSIGYTGVFWDFQSQLPVYVDPARWLERWRPTLENPYTVSVDPMLTTSGILIATPEPVALSCVTSQCAGSSGLLVRSYCSDGGFRHHGIVRYQTPQGACQWARDTRGGKLIRSR
jgi:hypothetical protein